MESFFKDYLMRISNMTGGRWELSNPIKPEGLNDRFDQARPYLENDSILLNHLYL